MATVFNHALLHDAPLASAKVIDLDRSGRTGVSPVPIDAVEAPVKAGLWSWLTAWLPRADFLKWECAHGTDSADTCLECWSERGI